MLDRLLPTSPQLWGGNVLSLTPFSPHGLVPANEVQREISLGEEFWENFCFLPKKAKSLGFTLSLLPALDTEESLVQWQSSWSRWVNATYEGVEGPGPSKLQAVTPDLILLPEKQLTV